MLKWHDVLGLYFVCGKDPRSRQDDDLVFVRKLSLQGLNDAIASYFVRRWAPKLDNLIGEKSVEVDWRRSFHLIMIAHTTFTVTMAICSHRDLRNHQAEKNKPLSPIYKVVKTVYASPSRVNFHLDSQKEVVTMPAYPDICFAVDDFDSTFDAVVLTETDHCYCVILNAHDGAAFPKAKEPDDCSSSDSSSLKIEVSSAKAEEGKVYLLDSARRRLPLANEPMTAIIDTAMGLYNSHMGFLDRPAPT